MEKIPSSRLFLFHSIAILIVPLLALVFLEAGLHIAGFGYDSHFLIPYETQREESLINNRDFTAQFFSKNLARAGVPVCMTKHKSQGTYRIFVLGESAAAGYPIPDFSFSRMLGAMLKAEFPDINFEIINTSIVAINSHVILKMAQELGSYQPDMFILYIGNNEVVGPYGPGTIFAPFTNNLFLIRSIIYLKSTKIGQLLQFFIDHLGMRKPVTPQVWDGMAMFWKKQINQDDPRMKRVFQFYERNLNDIITVCRHSGAKVVLSTVGSNIKDMAPFGSAHEKPVGEKWVELYESAIHEQQAKHYTKAVKQFLLAAHLDDSYAELYFRLGSCYEDLDQFDLARASYTKARDADTLRFRADTKINDIIRKIAAKRKGELAFADSSRNFETHSPHGISGNEFFYEHVHMNFSGQYLLATSLWPSVRAQLPQWILKDQKLPQSILSKEECAQYLGYPHLEEYLATKQIIESLANRPPFTQELNHQALMDHLEQELNSLKDGIQKSGVRKALQEYEYALKRNPQDPWIYYHVGRAYLLLNQPQEAQGFLRFAVLKMPSLIEPSRLLKLTQKELLSK